MVVGEFSTIRLAFSAFSELWALELAKLSDFDLFNSRLQI